MQIVTELLTRRSAPGDKLRKDLFLVSGHYSDWRDSTGKCNCFASSTASICPKWKYFICSCPCFISVRTFKAPWAGSEWWHPLRTAPRLPPPRGSLLLIGGWLKSNQLLWKTKQFKQLFHGQKYDLFRREETEVEPSQQASQMTTDPRCRGYNANAGKQISHLALSHLVLHTWSSLET